MDRERPELGQFVVHDRHRDTEPEFPERILIVEDDPTIRLMLQKAFSKDAQVIIAHNGHAALEMIAAHEPDFVVTDLSLPGMDGLSLITHARRTFVGACTPILVLTANDEQDVLLGCFRQGADDFMAKPFSISELRMRVSSIYLRQRVARDMNPLTRLPGNLVIKRELATRLKNSEPFAVAYLDVDHFKPFNDSKGFDLGDRAISVLASILRDYASAEALGRVFIGHVGGDDFVMILPPDDVHRMANMVHARWVDAIAEFYSKEELERGMVDVFDRKGDVLTVPLLSLSIGVLTSWRDGLDDLRKIAQVSAEVKHMAKKTPGNSLFIDRRTKYP